MQGLKVIRADVWSSFMLNAELSPERYWQDQNPRSGGKKGRVYSTHFHGQNDFRTKVNSNVGHSAVSVIVEGKG